MKTTQVDALCTAFFTCCDAADNAINGIIQLINIEYPDFFYSPKYWYEKFVKEYNHCVNSYEGTSRVVVFSAQELENELKENLFSADEKTRSYYKKYVENKLREYLRKKDSYLEWIQPIDIYESEGYLPFSDGNVRLRPNDEEYNLLFAKDEFKNKLWSFAGYLGQTSTIIEKYFSLFSEDISLDATSLLILTPTPTTSPKLKFKCKPAVAGYLISELIRQDYIEIPLHNGDINMTELGRICSQIFELPEGFKTNAEGWRKVLDVDNNTGNQLTDIKRAKLKLPPRTDLD
jgi:hypothetical protein